MRGHIPTTGIAVLLTRRGVRPAVAAKDLRLGDVVVCVDHDACGLHTDELAELWARIETRSRETLVVMATRGLMLNYFNPATVAAWWWQDEAGDFVDLPVAEVAEVQAKWLGGLLTLQDILSLQGRV